MITFIAKIDTQEIIEISGLIFDEKDSKYVNNFKKNVLAINYSTPASNILLYRLSKIEEKQYLSGDDYDIKWNNSRITSLDFSKEQAKKKYVIEVSSQNITLGEPLEVTITFFENNGITVDTSVTAESYLPIKTPVSDASIKISVVDGIGHKTITLQNTGVYTIGIKRYMGFVISQNLPSVSVNY